MPTQFTEAQLRALATDRNVCVTANAGSGKTSVLVERIITILLNTPDTSPEQIAAITFTEKAAAELRERVVKRLDELQKNAPATVRLVELRASIHHAFIGTIHGFCRTILRMYPLEANVDAAFAVIDSGEAEYLMAEAITETLRHALDPDSSDTQASELVRAIGRRNAAALILSTLKRREIREEMDALLGRTDTEVLAIWQRVAETEVRTRASRLAPATMERLGMLFAFEGLGARWTELCNGTLPATECRDVAQVILTKDGKLRGGSKTLAKVTADDMHDVRTLAEVYGDLKDLFGEGRVDDPDRLRMARTAAALAREADDRYRRKKHERGGLDFDDLQLHTVALLADVDVRAEIVAQFSFLLVDEFQDTNRLQLDLVHRLTGGFREGNCFIVGDPKQSIYRFRNADVSVFRRAREATLASVHDGVPGSSEVFAESFRMLPAIANAANAIFSRLMRDNPDVTYTPIIAKRSDGRPDSYPQGRVECIVLSPPPDNGNGSGDEDAGERSDGTVGGLGDAVAARINAMTGDRSDAVVVVDTNGPRQARYGDIAILLRSRNPLPNIESALRTAGIPYRVYGGIGFYGRQEVLDLTNYLRFLVDPEDDVALAAVLRSPYYLISDPLLFTAAQSKGVWPLWKRIRDNAPLINDPTLSRAIATLTNHAARAHRVPLYALMRDILVDTGWVGTIAGHPHADQVRANVEKLLALVREVQGYGFTGLYDVVQALERRYDSDDKEGQAEVDTGVDAVRIMTVHGSKGLEFPIVMVPALDSSAPSAKPPFFDPEMGVVIAGDAFAQAGATFHVAKLRELHAAAEESKRLFYVAATRARDAMVFITPASPRRRSWGAWLQAAIGFNEDALEQQTIRVDDAVVHVIPATALASRVSAPVAATDDRHPHRLIDRNVIASRPAGELFSASHLVTRRQCARKYVLRYGLGMDEDKFVVPNAGRDGDERIYGKVLGTIVHSILSRWPFERADIAELAITHARAAGLAVRDAQEVADRAAALVETALDNEAWRPLFDAPDATNEHELVAALGEHFLHGIVDRLVYMGNGAWLVIDYKTDNVTRDTVGARIKSYDVQLRTYAALVLRSFADAQKVTCVLLFLNSPDLVHETTWLREQLPELEEQLKRCIFECVDTVTLHHAQPTMAHCELCPFNLGDRFSPRCLGGELPPPNMLHS
jgi:ATP-dependent helicase/nuclease subunit A